MKSKKITITTAYINKLAKKYATTSELIKQVYDDMTEQGKNTAIITPEVLENQVIWMKEQGVVTFETYREKIDAIIKDVQKNNEIKASTNPVSDNELRRKLGYNNSDWRKLKITEKHMVVQLKKLIAEFVSNMIARSEKYDDTNFMQAAYYSELNERWKNFARNYAIREYPKANTHKNIRVRIIGLFEKKLGESLKEETPIEKVAEELTQDYDKGLVDGYTED